MFSKYDTAKLAFIVVAFLSVVSVCQYKDRGDKLVGMILFPLSISPSFFFIFFSSRCKSIKSLSKRHEYKKINIYI